MKRIGPIRYATAERFEPPRPATDDRPASGAICPQAPSRLAPVMGAANPQLPQSEDCLNLSITTPACDGAGRPVMVWLHGGAFVSGGGLQSWYDGAKLTQEHDVVVVSVNYRLGAFGFLRLDGVSDGNLGLLDQLEALRWVQRNIAEYGGDPSNVTVFGQSAGGLSTALLLGMPEARDLLQRAILQSAPLPVIHQPDRAEDFGRGLADELKTDLRAVTPQQLIDATTAVSARRAMSPLDIPFAPIAGVYPVAAEVGQARAANGGGRDVMYGYTLDETTAFGIPAENSAQVTRLVFEDPLEGFRADLVAGGSRAYSYCVRWRPEGSPFGATHCVELPLLLGDENAWQGSPMLGVTEWDEVERFGRAMRRAWATFAHNGIPDTRELDGWPVSVDTVS